MTAPKKAGWVVLVAALGYFVDIYDLVLFTIVRVKSLQALGFEGQALLDRGVYLLNMQMSGLLLGGVLWGVLGDKRGRLSVLFGSILTYSLANLANGFVTDVTTYGVLRFIAGIGLAGELGAGITLVSEILDKKARGFGTTIVATVGICGAVVAALIGDMFEWRTAYFVGGGLGLSLLVLRIGVFESGMFERVKARGMSGRANFAAFFERKRFGRYVAIILVGVPIWYAVGILVTFAPEIGLDLGMTEAPTAGRAILFTYSGLALGDLGSGLLSQAMRSRKRVLAIFVGLTAVSVVLYFTVAPSSLAAFYAICVALGVSTGYWAVFVTVAAEQFGTNLRATATTTAPNFVRGAVVPLSLAFKALALTLGASESAIVVGLVALVPAAIAIVFLRETYGRDLDYVDE